nr:MAG TPA: hypothetical protein [Caudoviricetes sp.]
MEIRIDERLVEVFNEVVEKDAKYFHGETNLEKFINSQLADFLCFIDEKNDNEFLSEEASDKLLDFLIKDIENDEIGQGLAVLAKILKAVANK